MTIDNPDGELELEKTTVSTITPRDKHSSSTARLESNPFISVRIDLNTSCNIQDAIAKMLGWLRETVTVGMFEEPSSIEEMAYCPEIIDPLEDIFVKFRAGTIDRLISVHSDINSTDEIREEALQSLRRCNDLIIKARIYGCAITDEIAKAELSQLRIDRDKTASEGETYITLKSLDEWATKEYNISILDSNPLEITKENALAAYAASMTREAAPKDGLSKTRTDHLFVTFALAVEAFANIQNSGYKTTTGKPIVSAIAEHLSSLAGRQNSSDATNGQSIEAIKMRIEEAIEKKTKLFKAN